MREFLSKYGIVLTFFIFLFVPSQSVAQAPTETDTLLVITNLQKTAVHAIVNQNYKDAMVRLNLANKLAATTNFRRYKLDVEIHLAELYSHLRYFEKSASEIQHVLAQLDSTKNDAKKAKAYKLYGFATAQTGNFKVSALALDKAGALYAQLHDEKSGAIVLLGKGVLELQKKEYHSAIHYFDSVIPVFKTKNLPYYEALANLGKADAYLKASGSPAATAETKLALARARELNAELKHAQLSILALRLSAQIAMREQDFGKAENDFQAYLKKKDSINQVYYEVIEEGIQAEWTVSNLNEIIAAQKRDLAAKEKSLFFGKLTGWLSIAIIIILSLFTLSLYKNNHLRIKTNKLLEDKNTELIIAKDKAEKASQVKTQFLSTITHELRTPMYTVTGLTHLLLEEDPKPEQAEHLNSLKFSGEYLLSLINNILDLNKLEANKVELEKIPFNLKKRMESVLTALKKAARDKNTQLHLEFDKSLPNVVVGDSLKISQILINLISNAVKFTENGHVWVRLKKLGQTSDTLRIHFEVEDSGVGISKKNQNKIFESFTQGSLQINRKFGGTGLGLSIVKNLLDIMGSRINLESKLGKGSKFWFDIDYALNLVSKTPATAALPEPEILKDKTVLIVEDNKINQLITKKILEKKEMACTVVDNGLDAVKLSKKNDFDIILMDIHMPGISGIEATKKIRVFNPDVPIIALTAVTLEESLDDFYKAGFNEFIPKPFKAEDFFEKIKKVLREHPTAKALK